MKMKKEYRSFEDARKFVHQLGLKNEKEWRIYLKSGNKPDDIASHPARVYKNKGWISLGDWFGTGRIAERYKKFKSFEDAQKFVRALGLQGDADWRKYCRSGNKLDDIPSAPWDNYKNKGWISLGDFLGTGRIADQKKIFRDFKQARKFVHSLKLKNQKEWQKFTISGNKPNDIPSAPKENYKEEWAGFGDWLGTGAIATITIRKNYLPFQDARNEARKLAKKYNIKTSDDWNKAVKEGKIPKNIPMKPSRVYSKRNKK